jgi:ABC-type phosphate/phosphonate transport system substrate-binding protein
MIPLSFVVVAVVPRPKAAAQEKAAPIRIGLPSNLFRDVPKPLIQGLLPTFGRLMESQTGMKGEPIMLAGAEEVTQQLLDNRVHFGVYHGFEYAWAQSKHNELKPLVVAIGQSPKLQAQLIVAKDSKIEKLEDLKDQKVAIPHGTREHVRLFLSRRTRGIGHRQEKFFKEITNPQHVAAALDDVATGKVQATVVDSVAWEDYKFVNPGRAARLRPLMKSETFPTGVIVYKEGGLGEQDLNKFKSGLTTAHQRAEGLQLMMLWKMSRFDVVPADYQQMLTEIVRAYPPIGDEP